MFNIHIDDGKLNFDEIENICYIVSKDGIFLRKKVGLVDSMVKVDNISFLNSKLNSYGEINIPKIPKNDFEKIVKFFQWAYKKHSGESVVLIYYNSEDESFDVFPTDQKVSNTSINYVKSGLSHTGYLLIGTIHSHANFGAGHSGIDDDDELNFDGVHITVGNVTEDIFSLSCSVVINGMRFMYQPEKYVEGIEKHNTEKNNILKDRYYIPGIENVRFNEEWKDKVQKRIFKKKDDETTKWLFGNQTFNKPSNSRKSDDFGMFDYLIERDRLDKQLEKHGYVNEVCKGFVPCDHCIYRDYKSEKMLSEILEDYHDELYFDIENEDDENLIINQGSEGGVDFE